MKKILIIDNDQTVVAEVEQAIRDIGATSISLDAPQCEKAEYFLQIENLCQEQKFDLALLDYELWGALTGGELVSLLKKTNTPFVAFSSRDSHNKSLVQMGAISEINKGNLYGSRGFDVSRCAEKLKDVLAEK